MAECFWPWRWDRLRIVHVSAGLGGHLPSLFIVNKISVGEGPKNSLQFIKNGVDCSEEGTHL